MKKTKYKSEIDSRDLLLLAAGAAATVLMVLISFFAIQNKYLEQTINAVEKATEEAALENETSTWQIYTNEEFGISFKYPTSWGKPTEKTVSTNSGPSYKEIKFGTYLKLSAKNDTYNSPYTLATPPYSISDSDTFEDLSTEDFVAYKEQKSNGDTKVYTSIDPTSITTVIFEFNTDNLSDKDFANILATFRYGNESVKGASTSEYSCLANYSDILSEISQCEDIDELACYYYKGVFDKCNESCLKEASADECLRVCMPVCDNR